MMIQAVLGNPNHPEYGVATIPFPIPHDQYAYCIELLEALEIGDAVKTDCKVTKIDSFYTVLKRTEMLTVNVQNYGYIVETERYRYCLRCNPSPGDYNGYLTAYDLDVQRQNMARDKPLVGRVTYANGDAQEFTDADEFLRCVQEELPYRPTTGLRYEVLTDDPNLRKQVDDMIFDFYGEENFSAGL